jgi:hypothetical protein
MIYHVMWSGTAKKCFLSIGQYDIKSAIWCDEFGGQWMKIEQPSTAAPVSQEGAHAALEAGLEEIARSWDGCMYDDVIEETDVGAALRAQFKRLKTPASADRSGDHG